MTLGQNPGGSTGKFVSLSSSVSRAAFFGSWHLLKEAYVIFVVKIERGEVNEGQK